MLVINFKWCLFGKGKKLKSPLWVSYTHNKDLDKDLGYLEADINWWLQNKDLSYSQRLQSTPDLGAELLHNLRQVTLSLASALDCF